MSEFLVARNPDLRRHPRPGAGPADRDPDPRRGAGVAAARGLAVSPRGRVPGQVRSAYDEAHAAPSSHR